MAGSRKATSRRRDWLVGSAAAGLSACSSSVPVPSSQPVPSAQEEILRFARGLESTQMVYVAAEIGVADALAGGEKTTEELAAATRTHSPTLYRFLRALVSIGVLAQREPNRFSLTPMGELLRTDHPEGLRDLVLWNGAEWRHRVWANLTHSVRTGETAMEHTFGVGLFDYMKRHPEDAAVYRNYMTFSTRRVAASLTKTYNFEAFRTVADVGGSEGLLLAAVLKSAPQLRGILFELPESTDAARKLLTGEGVIDRCQVVGGSFFDSVPASEVYVLMRILRDWSNRDALRILTNCRRSIEPQGRVLVIEKLVPAGRSESRYPITDIHMLVETGGQLRTEEQHRSLLDQAGFRLDRVIPLGADMGDEYPMSLLEAMPV